MLNQSGAEQQRTVGDVVSAGQVPLGARIIRTVRAYDALMHGKFGLPGISPSDAIKELWRDVEAEHDPMILHALERVVTRSDKVERALAAAAASEPTPVGAI